MALQVILAGHNLDREALQELLQGQAVAAESLSPETLSAAYARISRDPRPVPELRADSRRAVERARRSNRSIIFDMGHASVAEHAVFNLDVLGLSRLGVEALEHHRLASYTEKSQRYIRLEGDAVRPAELAGSEFEAPFAALVGRLAAAYSELARVLTDQARAEAQGGERERELQSRANEDARYLLPLCAGAQLGMTVNARTLELMIARCASHPLDEVRCLGRALYAAVSDLAPSVVRYTQATEYFRDTPAALGRHSACLLTAGDPPARAAVRLVEHTPEPEAVVLAGLLYASGACPWEDCRRAARSADPARHRQLLRELFDRMQPWDQLPRAFELVEFGFELTLSAAAFAQLKRHRMSTLLAQPYDPGLGCTVPAAVERAGRAAGFHQALEEAEALHARLAPRLPAVAPYCLTNAHRRRVLLRLNGRALGHFARLRCDAEAQWDIRALGAEMIEAARTVMPLAGAFYGGKDCVEDLRGRIRDSALRA